jgi:hypothetical protein
VGRSNALGLIETIYGFLTEPFLTPIMGAAYALAYLRLREFGGESPEQAFHPELAGVQARGPGTLSGTGASRP